VLTPVTLSLPARLHGGRDPSEFQTLLEQWFGSPFWGAPTRRRIALEVTPSRDGAETSAEFAALVASILGAPPGERATGTPEPGPRAFADLSHAAQDLDPLSPDDLEDAGSLRVVSPTHPPVVVPGLAGLLALLLVRRLDVRFGEAHLRAFQGARSVPRATVLQAAEWDPGLGAPVHLLLPTAVGARLRRSVGDASLPVLAPPATFAAVVGHLCGTPASVRAGHVGLLPWLTGRVARWDPELTPWVTGPSLRRVAVGGLRWTLGPIAGAAAHLPFRPSGRRSRWPLQLLSGTLPVFPAVGLVEAEGRALIDVR